ncbi:beta-1,6-N-acetylglucosaminyltransferase [Porphyromonas pasteri]|uniref:Peptide O-xylosyltransferase n=1 Tax=Porphyromonas pasteri TaxID=1583331 RepID=A0ABQ2H8G5_9PORP|nr:beta-1,6-N-acetylglucosaminyltransferase [Porphyromonas pasteri]GGM51716.1 glycosyl transferase [Porphyromonas pasteri]
MKHAYLILAHNEPELLSLLVERLDDVRNDIYIHFDRKLSILPDIKTQHAGLYILKDRVDVRWADVSMLEAEYKLFHAVVDSGSQYSHHHLISGVDLPLKNQDYIHSFFAQHQGKEFVGLHQRPMNSHADRALHYWHPFTRSFRGSGCVFAIKRILRYLVIQTQVLLGIRRNTTIPFHKGGQWVSITHELIDYLLEQEDRAFTIFSRTFGADEYFVPTLIWDTPFMERLFDATDESRGAMRYIGWRADGQLIDFTSQDLPALQQTEYLFARKFNSRDKAFLQEILALSTP